MVDRGGSHVRTIFYKPELTGLIDSYQIKEKAALFEDFEESCTLFDTLIICRFYRDLYSWEKLGQMMLLTSGQQKEKAYLLNIAA